jgi:hypothetical protein
MTSEQYLSIMRRALSEEIGVKLGFTSLADALKAARKIYRLRDKIREQGDGSFDVLSLSRTTPCELRLYRRDRHIADPTDDGLAPQQSTLARNELPPQPHHPRGPKRRRYSRLVPR